MKYIEASPKEVLVTLFIRVSRFDHVNLAPSPSLQPPLCVSPTRALGSPLSSPAHLG